tara:strand:+ start:3392 stop:4135 length:744 start_codon:yes stop_codon:yes gene_type:complete
MNIQKHLFLLFSILVFAAGGYVYAKESMKQMEGFEEETHDEEDEDVSGNDVPNLSSSTCPDMLIKTSEGLLLYNSKEPKSENNPIPFYNLDEYVNYLDTQRQQGVRCPVLYFQEEENTQGETVYRNRPSPFDPQGGLPQTVPLFKETPKIVPVINSGNDSNIYNNNMYNSFDPHGLQQGQYTPIDKIHESTKKGSSTSDNPMDTNWGGVLYTQKVVESGKYKHREVEPPNKNIFAVKDKYPTKPNMM